MKKNKICIYLRVGNSSQLNHIDIQKNVVNRFVKCKFKSSFIEYYIDDSYSGRSFNRPGMVKLINDIENNKVDIIVVNDYSRISKNLIELYNFINEYLIPRNIQLISVKEGPYKDYKREFDYMLEHILEVE